MAILPFEIIEDILRRLPVKSLKRFRTVAKSWCFLIDSENFIKLHLRHSLISNSNRNLILGGLGLYTINLDSLHNAHAMKPPFYYRSSDGISNSCNGLVLVMGEPLVLWNPFSAEYRVLPRCPFDYHPPIASFSRTTFGFGYATENDDYKVVRVVEFRHQMTHSLMMDSEASIYSLKSNSWRRIGGFPYPLPSLRGSWGVHVNGSFHTLVDDIRIMSFSVESEQHLEVSMPPGVGIADLNLDVIQGSLCVVCSRNRTVDIWVMKEYGVKESWIKLLSVSKQWDQFVKPLVYSKDGSKVLLNCDDKRLIWYDLETKQVEVVHIDGLPFVFYAEACVETLVSPNEPNPTVVLLNEPNPGKDVIKRNHRHTSKRDDFLAEGFNLVL